MAKKVILKDLNNIEILPITRGELIVDSSGNKALHSNEFLATDSLPGLMSAEDKQRLDNFTESGVIYDLVSTTTAGLAPQIQYNLEFIDNPSLDWVLTSTNGNTPTWRSLPINAFLNYYRPISINGTSILENNNTALNLVAGNNITLVAEKDTNDKYTGKLIINSSVTNITGNAATATKLAKTVKIWGLDFDGSSDVNGVITSNITGSNPAIQFANGEYIDGYGNIALHSTKSADWNVKVAEGSVLFRIKKNGNVLIGTSTDSGYKLDVNGSVRINDWLRFPNNKGITVCDTSGNNIGICVVSANNNVVLCTGASERGLNTIIRGNNLLLQYGNMITGLFLNSSGNVTIGSSDLAGSTYKLYVDGNTNIKGSLTAVTFLGNLDGTYVNKLTGYTKAVSPSDLVETDTLNIALGKLEYKADIAYSWYRSITEDDTDGIINKWDEIVDFVNGLEVDLLDEFVTRKTDLVIEGSKTFSKSITSTVADGTAPFVVASKTRVINLNADYVGSVPVTKLMSFIDGTITNINDAVGNKIIPYMMDINPFDTTKTYFGAILQWSNTCNQAPSTPNSKSTWYYQLIGRTTDHGLYFRRQTNGTGWSDIKEVAFTDSDITGNAATATKLKNKVKLWGNDFDGSLDVNGNIISSNSDFAILANSNLELLRLSTTGSHVNLAIGAAVKQYNTYVYGKNICFKTDTTTNVKMVISNNGNVGIGTTTNLSHKLNIDGNVFVSSYIDFPNSENLTGIVTNPTDAWTYKIIDTDGITTKEYKIPHYGYAMAYYKYIHTNGTDETNIGSFISDYFGLKFHAGTAGLTFQFGYGNGDNLVWGTTLYGDGRLRLQKDAHIGTASARYIALGGSDEYVWIDSRNSSGTVMNNIVIRDDKVSVRNLYPLNSTYNLGYYDYRWQTIFALNGNFTGIVRLEKGSSIIDGTVTEQIRGVSGVNDYWSIGVGATANDQGFVEFRTGDNGNEPIYFAQLSGSTVKNRITLMNANGNTLLNGLSVINTIISAGFMKQNSSDSYVLLGGGGHKTISDFLLKSDELNNNLTVIEKELTVTQDWMDTGISGDDLATGTYIVLIVNNHHYRNYSSGIMSWYSKDTNDVTYDEIILHCCGYAYQHRFYLRTIQTLSGGGGMKLLIAANDNLGAAYTYTFKFKRVI